MSTRTQENLPPVKYLCVGHQSQDIHIAADGKRSAPEHGGASLYTALTAWLLTGERVAVVSATGAGCDPEHGTGQKAAGDTDTSGLETYADPAGEQTVFEDWLDGDSRRQRLLSRAPAIDSSLEPLGHRGLNASTVFAGPLLDELPLDCRSWFWAEFACLIPQGWFRVIGADGVITLSAPDISRVTGPWDLVVLSHEEADATGDLSDWKRIAQILTVTHGSEGATVYSDGGEQHIAAIQPAEVVDTTGAGDVWSAAFAIRFNETRSITEAGRFAAAAGAICVSRKGLRGVPASRKEIERLLTARN
ncbi:MAG: PfkB family carbohydrate kinase [Chloroflexi bacterium]|nr:PfkB family carbohydrate kinase [Chloroflexota bacterium]